MRPGRPSAPFLRFAAAGAIGFAVDASVLHATIALTGASPYAARMGSYLAAATATWSINRRLAFPDAPASHPVRQWARFLVANAAGAAANYAVFAALVALWPLAHELPAVAVAGGSAAGLVFNFHLSKRFVFSR